MELSTASKFDAYYQMWVGRMAEGHNPESRAMHYGYSPNPDMPLSPDQAKQETNILVARQLGLSPDAPVTLGDLGCGVGGTAHHMADMFPNGHVIGMNIHIPQLQLVQRFEGFPSDRITLVNADFLSLPLTENSLDGAYAIDSSCYADDKLAFYAEALRCLKPNGKLVVFDVFDKRPPKNEKEEQMYIDSCTGWVVPRWHPVPQYKDLDTLALRTITDNIMPDLERSFKSASEKINKTTDPILLGHYEAIMALHECLQSGLVQYGLFVITKT